MITYRGPGATARLGPGMRGGGAGVVGSFPHGRLAQGESASFTPKRSLVRSQYRPLPPKAPDQQVQGPSAMFGPKRRQHMMPLVAGLVATRRAQREGCEHA